LSSMGITLSSLKKSKRLFWMIRNPGHQCENRYAPGWRISPPRRDASSGMHWVYPDSLSGLSPRRFYRDLVRIADLSFADHLASVQRARTNDNNFK
jgi:hypothetical protein